MSERTGVLINTVAFGDGGLEISYVETREQSPTAGMIRTMFFDVDEIWEPRVADIMDSIEEIIEEGLVRIRNPQYNTRKNIRERARELGERRAEEDLDDNDD